MENATNIANKSLHKYPQLKNFIEILTRNSVIQTKKVGREFDYPAGIIKNKLISNYGIFMDYFIRKVLSNQYQIPLTDDVTELVLKEPDTYLKDGSKVCCYLSKAISNHYEIFKDPKNQAMDILKSIKLVSLTYTLSFHDPLPKAEVECDNESLQEIIKYFKNLPYSHVEMKSSINCKYFEGNADLIFDQEVLYEIKTSKYSSLSRNDKNIHVKNFYKLILYGFGYYKKTGKLIKCFKIYNPLLGHEHTLKFDDIDMKHFEQCLSKK
ncbi:hypothetical protein FF38_14479 [Lucilia cuprina]|uniref:Uncharacterized protein n=1 Tax=Lucilia cuprina TaxID=7375 RepID=A0A0L0C130_LUCCU|nr:hypothetical protein FF38_14479 [Lucilia cuprina]